MKTSSLRITSLIALSAIVVTFFVGHIAFAQVCKPVSQRTGEVGCWIMANTSLGLLPKERIFWHLYTYATRAEADAAKGPRGTVVESLGKVWLFTIDVEGWRSSSGERVAVIGPLPVIADVKYSCPIHGSDFHTRNDSTPTSSRRTRSLVHINWRNMPGNFRGLYGRTSGRTSCHCAGRSTHASHRYRQRDSPFVGSHSPRFNSTTHHPGE